MSLPAPLSLTLPVLAGSLNCLQTLFHLQNVPKMPIRSSALRKLKKFQTEALCRRVGKQKRGAPSLTVSPSASVGYSSWDGLCPPPCKQANTQLEKTFLANEKNASFCWVPCKDRKQCKRACSQVPGVVCNLVLEDSAACSRRY